MGTTTDLSLTPSEFEEQYGDQCYWTFDAFELTRNRPDGHIVMRKLNEVLEQCLSPYAVDVVIGKVYFSSETDAITCSAMLETVI